MIGSTYVVFDVEGTLIDCAAQTIECWLETLLAFRLPADRSTLQHWSGYDGRKMLEALFPNVGPVTLTEILHHHETLYERKFLPTVRAFDGVHEVFAELRGGGCLLAIATTCKERELEHYDGLIDVVGMCAAVECGSDVKRGKPYPDLFEAALAKLPSVDAGFTVGDTPYDAMAALACGLRPIGVLTGGFTVAQLQAAGCCHVESTTSQIGALLRNENRAAPARKTLRSK